MSAKKIRIFVSSTPASRFTGVAAVENLINSELDVLSEEQLLADPSKGKGIKIAWFRGECVVDYFEQELLPDLQLICKSGAGVDNIPLERLRKGGLRLTNTPEVVGDATADLALGLMISSGRGFNIGMKKASLELMDLAHVATPLIQDITNSTVGIVGMGDIGYRIAKRAKAFNANILYHSRTQRPAKEEAAVDATYYSELHSMLPLCDFVVISCILNDGTKNMFTMREFRVMKRTAHLINVARGEIVNTDDLTEALRSNEIAAAALDVTNPEPLPKNHPLLHLDNVIVLPHWGAATLQTGLKIFQLMIENTKAFAEGRPLLTEVYF